MWKVKRVFAYPDPGYNQCLQLDDQICDVIDWDQLPCLGDDYPDVASHNLPFPFIDWEANEEESFADATNSKSQGNKIPGNDLMSVKIVTLKMLSKTGQLALSCSKNSLHRRTLTSKKLCK